MENPKDMDLANNSLPSSRSSTPTMTNCERQKMVNQDEKNVDDAEQCHAHDRITLPRCNTPGCQVHSTPFNSPTKSKNDEFPELPKKTSSKRKEGEDGFISPTSKQTVKRQQLEFRNFEIEVNNRFEKINENVEDIAGNSKNETNFAPSKTNEKENPNSANTLPPPVFLKLDKHYMEPLKTLTEIIPTLRSETFPHYNLPTSAHRGYDRSSHPHPSNPISIISVYIPPRSDERLFTHDLEQLLQTNSNCVILGDLNVPHNEWNCSVNSTRGNQLKPFTDNLNLTIAYPNSPTRFGYRTSNTLDIAVINNFNFPFTIDSIPELSSDHNPVFLNFSLTTPIHSDNSRAVTTCWSEFRNNLKKSVRLSDFSGIRKPNVLEEKISLLTAAVCSAHHQASKPIENRKHSFTPNDIHDLIYLKNKAKR
ncbi:putative RNA-directed DNA polymerase from transposon X-element [Trichonephila clavipes]|nr:putative RNA-directed DNA polymerase from transposon X-element [Trichonephila clavipes]